MTEIHFKLCYTERTVSYTVDGNMDMETFYRTMKENLRRDMSIEGDCYIIPGPGLQCDTYTGCPEDYPPILVDIYETVDDYCKSNVNILFYVHLKD